MKQRSPDANIARLEIGYVYHLAKPWIAQYLGNLSQRDLQATDILSAEKDLFKARDVACRHDDTDNHDALSDVIGLKTAETIVSLTDDVADRSILAAKRYFYVADVLWGSVDATLYHQLNMLGSGTHVDPIYDRPPRATVDPETLCYFGDRAIQRWAGASPVDVYYGFDAS